MISMSSNNAKMQNFKFWWCKQQTNYLAIGSIILIIQRSKQLNTSFREILLTLHNWKHLYFFPLHQQDLSRGSDQFQVADHRSQMFPCCVKERKRGSRPWSRLLACDTRTRMSEVFNRYEMCNKTKLRWQWKEC